jgi:DNA-binding CsgD family transcriptional regulator
MTATPDQSIAVVEQWYAAYDMRAIDTLCGLAHPEIEVVPASPLLSRLPGASFHGHIGVRTLMTWSYAQYPDVRVASTVVRRTPGGAYATATYHIDGRPAPSTSVCTYAVFRLVDGKILRLHSFGHESDALAFESGASVLTGREREVLQLLAQGLKGPQIATALYLSPATVRTHVQNAMGRLGARTRTEAVSRALMRGDITL